MPDYNAQVAIIGGGITGLSAAWELQQAGISYMLIEKDVRWGGKIITESLNGALIEGGPEALVTRKPEVYDLALELGLEEQMQPASGEARGIYILTHGRPLTVPLSPLAFITSPLLSWRGKLRMLAEPLIPRRGDSSDESLAEFTRRRLGNEALERLVGPILGGIYNTDPHTQSILTTAPVMRELEATYGGLFRGLLGRMRAARRAHNDGAPIRPRFITFRDGTETLVRELVRQLTGDLRTGVEVQRVTHVDGNGYHIDLGAEESLHVSAVILAVPARIAAELISSVAPSAVDLLRVISHTHIGTVSLLYRSADLPDSLARMRGLMIPRREKRRIDAVTFTSHKTPEAAPADHTLLKIFVGGGAPDVVALDDDALLHVVQAELRDLLAINATPVSYRAYRWLNGYPQASVGHLDHVAAIERALPAGLLVTGSSYRGLAVPDCVRQGREAARKIRPLLKIQ